MKKNEIINKISVNNTKEWGFISQMLSKDCIEQTAENFANGNPYSAFEEFGLEAEDADISNDCMITLMKKASKKMWQNVPEANVSSLLEIMNKMNVVSVEMPDLGHYTAENIIKSWKAANEVENA